MTTRSHGLLDQIDELIKLSKQATSGQGIHTNEAYFVSAQLTKYGCILASAALEQALVEAGESYGARVGDRRIAQFVESVLSRGRNPDPEYIVSTLSKFDAGFGQRIETYMNDNNVASAVKSIVSNRNRIAHGQSVSFGVVSLEQWLKPIRSLCLEIHSIFDTATPNRSRSGRRRKRR